MPRYRQIPREVDAFRYGFMEIPEWFLKAERLRRIEVVDTYGGGGLSFYYDGQWLFADIGDYVVCDHIGDFAVIVEIAFVRQYTEVTE